MKDRFSEMPFIQLLNMRKSFFLFLILVIPAGIRAQKKLPEQGSVSVADLTLRTCSFEPDASALKLFDVQETDFETSTFTSRLKTERKVRIKIFNENGYKHATIRIPYLRKRGSAKIKKLEGAVYSLGANGKISVEYLSQKDFFKEKAAENVGMVNFTFPNLKPGSIIEYSYTTIENNLMYLLPWFIQDEIPVAYTSRTVTTPVQYRVLERPYGVDSIEQQYYLLKYDRFRRTTYFKENIPSFKAEPYMSSINDYLVRVSFGLYAAGVSFTSVNKSYNELAWKAAGKSLLNSRFFEQEVRTKIPGTESIIDSARKKKSVEERIAFLYEEVKKRFPNKSEQTLEADSLKEAWNSKDATSSEINCILLNLLEQADVKCMPVLVSTRSNGKVRRDFPSLGQLNGVDVLALDSTKFYLLDASIKHQLYNNPPLNILNREALVLSPDSVQWVTIVDNRPLLKQSIDVYADVTENGKLEGNAGIQYFDYAKAYKLDTALQNENSGSEKFLDLRPAGLKIVSTKLENPENPAEPLFETIDFTYEPQNTDNYYFIDPQVLAAKNKNPFFADKRNTEIDFGCNQMIVLTMQIHFPASFQVDHLPKNMTIRAPDSSFFYKLTYSADKEAIYMSQIFEVKRAIFSKEEYPGIQDFFNRMHSLMAEEIILKKIK
jgi:hypothetical protein